MAVNHEGYQQLQQQPEKMNDDCNVPNYPAFSSTNAVTKVLTIIALLSSFGNLLWALQAFQTSSVQPLNEDRSIYASLERDVPTPYRDDTIFSSHNRTIADAAWDSWVVDPGIVALPHGWVKAKMLPQAQHWPWDGDKGIYLLNGFHNLHCLVCHNSA